MEKLDSSRTGLLIGQNGLQKLEQKSVTIVGTGGVGGYVAMLLARAGIGKISLIDFDKVSPSNLNRQIVAFQDTIGQSKVLVLKNMLQNINPNLQCNAIEQRISADNVQKLIKPCDVVVDAIDSVKDKIALIKYCKTHNIDIISAMGAGNRFDIPVFCVTDIFKTSGDGLAKVMRKALRDEGVDSLQVVASQSPAVKVEGKTIGSISYYPAMCGSTLAAAVINKFLQEEE